MEDFLSRLKYLIEKEADGKYSVFAKLCGIPHTTFYNYTKGRMPHSEHLCRIQETFSVDLNWLLSGIGEPYLSTKGSTDNHSAPEGSLDDDGINDSEIIKQFSDRNYARNLNSYLAQLEKLYPETFRDVGGYIKGLLHRGDLPLKPPTDPSDYSGLKRRTSQRRVKDDPGKIPGGKDRRSGKDRRAGVTR